MLGHRLSAATSCPRASDIPCGTPGANLPFFNKNQMLIRDSKNRRCLTFVFQTQLIRPDLLISEKLRKIAKAKSADQTIHREIEEILAKLDSFTPAELEEIIKKYEIKSPLSNNPLSAPMEFNLMFECTLGPEGKNSGFLRPETAQGKCSIYNSTLAKH